MRVLIGCETSGTVRRAFAARGHFAVSVDTQPAEDGVSFGGGDYDRIRAVGTHYQGDIFDFIEGDAGLLMDAGFDLFVCFYPCQYLSVSGQHWNNRGRGWEGTEKAVLDVRRLMATPFKRKAFENPVGILSTRIRKPDQTIQPYQFGHDASKRTCLWLDNLPRLKPTKWIEPRMVGSRPRWSNQTDSGQNKLTPSKTRATDRARTYAGIAAAMAAQWGTLD